MNIVTINDMKRILLVLCIILSQCSCKKDNPLDSFREYRGSAEINGVYYEDNAPSAKQYIKEMYLPFGRKRFVSHNNPRGLKTFFLQLDLQNPDNDEDSYIMMAAFSLNEGEEFPEVGKKYNIVYSPKLEEQRYPFNAYPVSEWFYDETYSVRENIPSIVGVAPVYSADFNNGVPVSTQGFFVFDSIVTVNKGMTQYVGKFVLENAPQSSSPSLRIEGNFKVFLSENI